MKKYFILSLMAVCSLMAMAQDNYAEAVKSYINSYTGNADISSIPQEMMDKVTNIYVEEFKANNVTLEDLDEMSKIWSTEKGQTYLAHTVKLQGQEAQQKTQDVLMPAMMPLFMGGEPKEVEVPKVSASYKAKFHKLYENAKMGAMFDAMFSMISGMLNSQPGAEETIKKLGDFITAQGENIILSLADGNLTEEDLDFGNATYSRPAAKRITKASSSATVKFLQSMMSQMPH